MTETTDFSVPADLCMAGKYKSGPLVYRRFPTAAEAIRFAKDDIDAGDLSRLALEFGEDRYEGNAIQALYDAPDYPLKRNVR
jgi:hypothetical protein